MSVKDIDKGWKRITNKILSLNGKTVSAGIHTDAGNEKNGVSIAQVATYNEFGTKRIPARPFIRLSFENHNKEWNDVADEQLTAMVNSGKTASGALSAVGEAMKKDIVSIIGDTSQLRHNAPSTIAKKGFDKPLYETGKLKAAIDYKVK
jgi:hypothetical protein